MFLNLYLKHQFSSNRALLAGLYFLCYNGGMKKWAFNLKGRIPSKKNSRGVFCKNGRVINVPSKRYEEWHKDAEAQLLEQGIVKFDKPVRIDFKFIMPDKRRTDTDNKVSSLFDLCTDMEILEDDSWQKVRAFSVECLGVDKGKAGVEVLIEELE